MVKNSDNTTRAALLFICFFLAVYGLNVTQNLLAPFALAVFFWLVIDGFARWIDGLSRKIPYWMALSLALFIVILGLMGVILIVVDTAVDIAAEREIYAARITDIFDQFIGFLSQFDFIRNNLELSANGLSQEFGLNEAIQNGFLGFASAIQSVVSNFFVIALYVVFLFAAQSSFPKKVDDLFPNIERRQTAIKVISRIRESIEKYIGVQTLMSLVQTILSYMVMVAFGLDNALFWAMVIFILNYIPIVGGIFAVIFPVLFAFIQFEALGKIGGLAGGLFLVQFVINNTLQPKMMGDSMNMSALVVILALAIWTALWGGVGAFLSAPLTVIIMIILAQFPTTRWIAILLSADGHPDMDNLEKAKTKARRAL